MLSLAFVFLLQIKLVGNVPSPFPSLLALVQHGSDLSLGGVLSPVTGPMWPGRPGQARSTAPEPER